MDPQIASLCTAACCMLRVKTRAQLQCNIPLLLICLSGVITVITLWCYPGSYLYDGQGYLGDLQIDFELWSCNNVALLSSWQTHNKIYSFISPHDYNDMSGRLEIPQVSLTRVECHPGSRLISDQAEIRPAISPDTPDSHLEPRWSTLGHITTTHYTTDQPTD